MFGEAAQEVTIKNLIDQRLAAKAIEKADYPEGAEHDF
jgi:hypothetical protein